LKYFVFEETHNILVYVNNQDPHFIINNIYWEVLHCGRVAQEYEKYCC